MKRLLVSLAIGLAICAFAGCNSEQKQYDDAVSLLNQGQYQDAIDIFKGLNGFNDSHDKINEAYESMIDNYLSVKDIDSAINTLSQFEQTADEESVNRVKMSIAQSFFDTAKYDQAFAIYKELGSYQGADKMLRDYVIQTYKSGAIDQNNALSYVSAYDILNDKDKAFVDFCKNKLPDGWGGTSLCSHFNNNSCKINGLLYTDLSAFHEKNTAKGYIIWYYNPNTDKRDLVTFFHLENGELSTRVVSSTATGPDFSPYYSPDSSYDLNLIREAIAEVT